MGQRKNLSPQRESNPWPAEHRVGTLSTELRELMEGEAINLRSCMTHVLHTAKNSNVEVIMVNNKWKYMMIHFTVGDKCTKDEIINMTLAWDKEKNPESPMGIELR